MRKILIGNYDSEGEPEHILTEFILCPIHTKLGF